MKRLAVYTFWDKDGILHKYHQCYLTGLKKENCRVLLVANGLLTNESRGLLDEIGVEYLVRENHGFDFAAWKAGLEYFGRPAVCEADELILCNCSCYGPIFPFSNSFDKMAPSACDFWGIYRQHAEPEKQIPSHIQSFFYVFRSRAIASECFWQWWDEFTPASAYLEEVYMHETVFTEYLEKHGLVSDTLLSPQKYDARFPDGLATMRHGDIILIEDASPLLKRKFMFRPYANTIMCLQNLKGKTDFPIDAICDDMIRNIDTSLFSIFRYWINSLVYRGERRKQAKSAWRQLYEIRQWKNGTRQPLD